MGFFIKIKGWVLIIRPWVCLSTGMIVLASHVSFGGSLQSANALLAAVGAMALAAAGAATNDLNDVEIDRIAHPHRPLPSGLLASRSVAVFAIVLFIVAWTLFLLSGLVIFLVGLGWSIALIGYSALKARVGVLANVLTGALTGFLVAVGSITAGGVFLSRPSLLALAVVAGTATVAREILKDVMDVNADFGRSHTLPMSIGSSAATTVAAVLVLLATGALTVTAVYDDATAIKAIAAACFIIGLSSGVLLLKFRTGAVRVAMALLKIGLLSGALMLLVLPLLKLTAG